MTTQPEKPTEPRPSLAAKLAAVVLEVTRVEKRGHNDFHDYDYATAADVLEAVRKGLASRNVVIVPRVVGTSVVEKQRKDKASEFITTADMVLTLLDGDSGEALECPWKGCGQDSGDKGIYKALTGGYKYFLLQLFMIPTGDDPEKDSRKRGEKREDRPAGPVSADAAAIAVVAGELSGLLKIPAETLIRDASTFPGKSGKPMFFTDPTKVSSEKWLKGVRSSLEKELEKAKYNAGLKAEPGVAEAAELFR